MCNFIPSERSLAKKERVRMSRVRAEYGVSTVPRIPWYSRLCSFRESHRACDPKSCDKCDLECGHLRPVDLKGTLKCDIGAMRDLAGRPL